MKLTIGSHAFEKLQEIAAESPLSPSDTLRAVEPLIIPACVGHQGKGWIKLVQFSRMFEYWRPVKDNISARINNSRSYQRTPGETRDGFERVTGDSLWAIVNVDRDGAYVKTFLIRESSRIPNYAGEWVEDQS